MKNNFKKIVSLMLVFCLATLAFMVPAADAQAAKKYKKSFTTTVTLDAWEQCEVKFAVKKDANVTVKASTKSTSKTLEGAVTFLYDSESFSPNATSVTLNQNAPKGTRTIYITNYTNEKITFTVDVSAEMRVVKHKKNVINSDDGWG